MRQNSRSNSNQHDPTRYTSREGERLLTAHVVGTTARVPVFKLDLRHVAIVVRHHVITIANVGLRLTKTAATALNGALGTTLFAENLFFGTARSKLVVG